MSLVDSTYHARSNSNPQKFKASSWFWSVMGFIRLLATFELFKDFNSHLLQKFSSVQFNAFMDDVALQVEVDRFEFWNGCDVWILIFSWNGRETRTIGEIHSQLCTESLHILHKLLYMCVIGKCFIYSYYSHRQIGLILRSCLNFKFNNSFTASDEYFELKEQKLIDIGQSWSIS